MSTLISILEVKEVFSLNVVGKNFIVSLTDSQKNRMRHTDL